MSYTEASRALEELHLTWKSSLSVEDTPTDSVAVKQLEVAVGQYLRRVSTKHDTRAVAKVTSHQEWPLKSLPEKMGMYMQISSLQTF